MVLAIKLLLASTNWPSAADRAACADRNAFTSFCGSSFASTWSGSTRSPTPADPFDDAPADAKGESRLVFCVSARSIRPIRQHRFSRRLRSEPAALVEPWLLSPAHIPQETWRAPAITTGRVPHRLSSNRCAGPRFAPPIEMIKGHPLGPTVFSDGHLRQFHAIP